MDSLSEKYYLEIIKNDNNYIKQSYAALSIIDSANSWDSLLYSLISDSTKFIKSVLYARTVCIEYFF